MNHPNDLYFDVSHIWIAHQFCLTDGQRCDHMAGRKGYGLVFVISGAGECRMDSGERFHVKAGDMIYFPDKAAYYLTAQGDFHHYSINFYLHEENLKGGTALLMPRVYPTGGVKNALSLCAEIVTIWQEKKCGYEMRAVGGLYRLLSAMADALYHAQKGEEHDRLLPAKEYIEKNITHAVSLSFLANLCYMSETNFRRSFLKVFGQTPLKYRNELLTNRARELLDSGYYSVSQVAFTCGFDDVSYFCRFFRKQTGLSPGAYRSV